MFGLGAVSILTFASACNKRGSDAHEAQQTSLAGKPRMLFFLFGDKADPRVLPVALIAGNTVQPIKLDSSGWHTFDKLYFGAASAMPLYQDGKSIGTAVVKRGMWSGEALYKLPRCRSPRPLAAVTLAASPAPAVMLELLATSDTLAATPPRTAPVAADTDSARALLVRSSQREGLTATARGELDEVLTVIPTGATAHPTLVGSYMERGSAITGKPRHVFAIGDYVEASKGYAQSFVHGARDTVPEFRRYLDHLDLTGDGVDEIVLEGWRTGGDSFLVILQYTNGRWREIARTAPSWCADPITG